MGQWLESIGLAEYQDHFLSHEIQGEELLTLGRQDLKVRLTFTTCPSEIPEKTRQLEVGGLPQICFKSVQNSADIFGYYMCIVCLNTLLNVVSHCDLSVLSTF